MKDILVTNKNYYEVGGDALNVHNDGGIIAWLNGEHGEETILRRAIKESLDRCADAGRNIAFDVKAFDGLGYKFSYLDSVFEEVARYEGKASADRVDRAVFYNIPMDMDRMETFERNILRPYEESQKLSFVTKGDELTDKFKEFLAQHRQIPFGKYLMALAERKGVRTRSQICMASGISKYTLSKLINSVSRPSKDSLAALAIGLKLTLDEAEELCNQVGYHLGDMDLEDKAVKFFIKEKVYDIDLVNYCLYCLGATPLGEKPREDNVGRGADIE